MPTYLATHHAIMRAKERVGIKGEGKELATNVNQYISGIMPTAIYLKTDENGGEHYRHRKYVLVVKENRVITFLYYQGRDITLANEIKEMVTRKIEREVKPLKKTLRDTSIKMHEAEIKKLKSYNPKSIQAIDEELSELNKEISSLKNEIEDIQILFKRYNLQGGS